MQSRSHVEARTEGVVEEERTSRLDISNDHRLVIMERDIRVVFD